MNTLSDIFDWGLQALCIPVATGCNGHILFVWMLVYAVVGAVFFRRWSWGAFAAAVTVGILGNLARIGILLTLVGIPHFHLLHDILGWFISGLAILIIVECYEPRRSTAVWIGRALCLLLILWALALVYIAAFPVPELPSGREGIFSPKDTHTGNSFTKGITP